MLIKTIKTEKLETFVYDSRAAMGQAAGAEAAKVINKVIEEKGFANVIFAAAPSQNETLAALLGEKVDFTKINAFHTDEYAGLGIDQHKAIDLPLRKLKVEIVFPKRDHILLSKLGTKRLCACVKPFVFGSQRHHPAQR